MQRINYETYEKPSDFVKFKEGDTTLRIISSGGLAKKHGMKTATGWVPLGECLGTDRCKHCLAGNEPKNKWMWLAIVRPDNNAKLLDVGPMIGDAICKIAAEKKQDPQLYDIVITRTGKGQQTKYSVKALAPTPIPPEEIKKSAAAKKLLIKKYFMNGEN